MRMQDVLSNLINYLVTIPKREIVVLVLSLTKKTRTIALPTGILRYKTKRIQDILTNIELNLITFFQLIVDKRSKTD